MRDSLAAEPPAEKNPGSVIFLVVLSQRELCVGWRAFPILVCPVRMTPLRALLYSLRSGYCNFFAIQAMVLSCGDVVSVVRYSSTEGIANARTGQLTGFPIQTKEQLRGADTLQC